jgi:hypothetical protein
LPAGGGDLPAGGFAADEGPGFTGVAEVEPAGPGAPLLRPPRFATQYVTSSMSRRMSTTAPTRTATRLLVEGRLACAGLSGPDIDSSLH